MTGWKDSHFFRVFNYLTLTKYAATKTHSITTDLPGASLQ